MSPAQRRLHRLLDVLLGPSGMSTGMPSSPHGEVVEQQLEADRIKAIHSVMPWAQGAAMITATAIVCILWTRLPWLPLLTWFLLRLTVSVLRWADSLRCQVRPALHHDGRFVLSALIDGVSWGALGWGLTPLHNLEVAVVTVSMGVAVSALGVTMLHVHTRANLAFLLPVTVPNAIYAAFRGDDLGLFCGLSYLGMTGALLIESLRLQRRSHDNIRLRLESDLARQAEAKARLEAQQLADMRTRFVATISHEMRTPLHGMLGLMRMVEAQAHLPPKAEHLELMRRSGEHLASIINDVLDYARMETSEMPISATPFNLEATLNDVIALTRVQAQAKGLSLALHSNLPAQALVLGDEMRIRQVLINLIGNAIKFTDTGGVKLVASRDAFSGRTWLSVIDTGIGISDSDQRTIFAPFTQAQTTQPARRFGGTGLGLSISRSLCQAMGGSLQCSSTLGAGTTFTCELVLPRASAAAANALASQPAVTPMRSPMVAATPAVPATAATPATPAPKLPEARAVPLVLLVDDNPVNTLVAEAELSNLGMNVHTVDDGQAAVDWFRDHQPDMVFMDCEMPGMDGVTATTWLRRIEVEQGRHPVVVVALTANGRATYEERCQPAGMNEYLCKPYDHAELVGLLERHLPRSSLPRAQQELAA